MRSRRPFPALYSLSTLLVVISLCYTAHAQTKTQIVLDSPANGATVTPSDLRELSWSDAGFKRYKIEFSTNEQFEKPVRRARAKGPHLALRARARKKLLRMARENDGLLFWRVTAKKRKAKALSQPRFLVVKQEAEIGGIVMGADADGANIPLEGAAISIFSADGEDAAPLAVANVAPSGDYTIGDLRSGEYDVLVEMDGFSPAQAHLEIAAGDIVRRDFILFTNDLGAGALEVNVSRARNGLLVPVEGAVVSLFVEGEPAQPIMTGETNGNGSALFDDVPEGSYHVLVQKQDFNSVEAPADIVADETTTLDVLLEKSEERVGRLAGHVFQRAEDQDALLPIEGAKVSLFRPLPGNNISADLPDPTILAERFAFTNEIGAYEFENLQVGRYLVVVEKDGFLPAFVGAEVLSENITRLDFFLFGAEVERGRLVGLVSVASDNSDLERHPIPGATVSLFRDNDQQEPYRVAFTGPAGAYEFHGLPVDDYSVIVEKEGFLPAQETAEIIAGEATRLDFSLTPLNGETGRLSGRVFQAADPNTDGVIPIEGARVLLFIAISSDASEPVAETTTNRSGEYAFDEVIIGDYMVMARKEGYTPARENVTILSGQETTQDLYLELLPIGSVEGVVVQKDSDGNDVPIHEAVVIIYPPNIPPSLEPNNSGDMPIRILMSTRTDENGRYEFHEVPEGVFPIFAHKEGFTSAQEEITVLRGATTTQNFVLEPIVPGKLVGAVYDASSDAANPTPIADARVVLLHYIGPLPMSSNADRPMYETRETLTDEQGNYVFEDVWPDDYKLMVYKEGYHQADAEVTVENGGTTTQDFFLEPIPRGEISGTVSEQANDALTPLTEAVVELFSAVPSAGDILPLPPRVTVTDENGAYLFDDVPEGEYTLVARKEGFTAEDAHIKVEAGATTTQDFTLKRLPAGVITGFVFQRAENGDEMPLPDAEVELRHPIEIANDTDIFPPPPPIGRTITGDDGSYTFNDVPEGGYVIVARKEGFAPSDAYIEVRAGETTEQNFLLAPDATGAIAGVVYEAATDGTQGQPLEGAVVALIGESGERLRITESEELGKYAFEDVPVGEYGLFAHKMGFRAEDAHIRVEANATTTQDFFLERLPTGAITGLVFQPGENGDEMPLPEAEIELHHGIVIADNTSIFPPPGPVRETHTADDGSYVFDDVPEGDYRIVVRKEGFARSHAHVRVEAGQTTEQDFFLTPTAVGNIVGVVYEATAAGTAGQPLHEAFVALLGMDGLRFGATHTNEHGEYAFEHVTVGEYILFAHKEGYMPGDERVEVNADETTEQNIFLVPAGRGDHH